MAVKHNQLLLAMLAEDELSKNNNDEAITLLTRAKSLLQAGMPSQIIDKVIGTLRQSYLAEQRYDADQTAKDASAFTFPPHEKNKDTPEDDIAFLVSAAKSKHRLIAFTDEGAVINLECRLPLNTTGTEF